MTFTVPERRGPPGLAFKAYEIEERIAVQFHRPVGMVFARAARAVGLTPIAVTLIATLAGMIGGALLYTPALWFAGFAFLVLHGILDSSDGQLARMTGQVSELGRVLDGVAGYLTHAAIYLALLAAALARGAGPSLFVLVAVAAISNVVHAQLYDYHRTTYGTIVIKGVATLAASGSPGGQSRSGGVTGTQPGSARKPLYVRVAQGYELLQRRLAGAHVAVERLVAARAVDGHVPADIRATYREYFYPRVRAWNLLGDNSRIYGIGLLALLHHVDWFFWLVAGPMNLALAVLWVRQAQADRRFLAAA